MLEVNRVEIATQIMTSSLDCIYILFHSCHPDFVRRWEI